MTIHPTSKSHCGCACPGCTYLDVYPVMPSIDPPDVNDLGNGDWEVWCNFMGPLIDGKATVVRRLFHTDGGSLPKATWSVMGDPWQMPMLAYFILHDAEYAAELFTRDVCDSRFLDGMAMDGRIGWPKRNAVWSAVRLFGGAVWMKHTEASVAEARKFCFTVDEKQYHAMRNKKCVDIACLQ